MTIVNMVGGGASEIEATYNEYTATTPYIAIHGMTTSTSASNGYYTKEKGSYTGKGTYKSLNVTAPVTLNGTDYVTNETITNPTSTYNSRYAYGQYVSAKTFFGTNSPNSSTYYVWKGSGAVTSNTVDDYVSGFLPDGTYNITAKWVISWGSSTSSDHLDVISTDYTTYTSTYGTPRFRITKLNNNVTIEVNGFSGSNSNVYLFFASTSGSKPFCMYFIPTEITPE